MYRQELVQSTSSIGRVGASGIFTSCCSSAVSGGIGGRSVSDYEHGIIQGSLRRL